MDSPSNITTTLHHHHQKQPFTLSPPPPPTTFSRYEDQKRRNWNTFGQYLKNHRPPLSLDRCSGAHVLEFLRYLDQFGKTKVHTQLCPFYGHPSPPAPCPCPLRQAWGSLDALAGRLRAAYEENGGKPETNPFGARAVTLYLREVRDSQSKARGVSYEKNRKRKRVPQPNHNHNHNIRENNKFCYSIKQQITGDPLNQSSMDEPCEICGDTGYVDAILICSKCKVTRAHRYCMFKMPEADQEIWVCDECDSSQRPSFKQARSEEPSGTKMRFMIKKPPQSSKVQYLTPEAVKGLESGIMRNSSASPSKSYVARRPSVNWPVMSKMEAAPSSSVHPQVSIKPNPRVGPSGRREPLNNWSIPPALKCKKWSASTEKENLVSGWQDSPIPKQSSARTSQGLYTMKRKEINGPARQQCGESPTAKHVTFETLPEPVAESNNINLGHTRQSFQCLPHVSSVDDANQVCVDTPIAKCVPLDNFSKADINSMHTFHFVGFSPPMNSGINVCAEAQPKLIDLKGKSSRATMEFDSYLPNHPAVSPTWKGVLKIPSDVLPYSAINGIQAHPPCRVHSQVYKLSKQLPELLHFEVQRREGSWLEIFEDGVPVELDIGLYFLYPLNGDSGQSYCSLLDYLDGHDLILRTCIDGVELFVFSSYHLPENSRKINQKHYLWGLFRPYEVKNKAALASDVECLARVDSVHSSDSQHVQQQMSEVIDAEDMDIDMLGGPEVVGKVDIVVPKPMDNACVDQREGERGPSDEMKASPLSTEGSAVDFSSIKIKEECTDDMENPLSFTASCADYEVEFEKELQRSFDKFTALMQVEDLRSLKMDIKEEINSFC